MDTELCYYGEMWRPLARHHSLKPASLLWAPAVWFISQLGPVFLVDTLPRDEKLALHLRPAFSIHPSQTSHSQRRGRRAAYAPARLIETRAHAQTAPLNQEPGECVRA